MGKTHGASGIISLAQFRTGSGRVAAKPNLSPLARGYYQLQHTLDTSHPSSLSRMFASEEEAVLFPPLSAVCSNENEAHTQIDQLIAAARVARTEEEFSDFEDGDLEPQNVSIRFGQSSWPVDLRESFSLISRATRGNIAATMPLIVTRAEHALSGTGRWSSTAYVYDPVNQRWFLIGRYGPEGKSAYILQYKNELEANQAGREFLQRLAARHHEVQGSSTAPSSRVPPYRLLK